MPHFIKKTLLTMLVFILYSCPHAWGAERFVDIGNVPFEKYVIGNSGGVPSIDHFVVADRSLGRADALKQAIREYIKLSSAKATLDDNANPLNILGDETVRAMISQMAIHFEGSIVLNQLKSYCESVKNKEADPEKAKKDIQAQVEKSLADLRYSLQDKGLGVLSVNATWPITRLLLYGVEEFDPNEIQKLRNKITAARMTANELQKIELLAIFAQLCDFGDMTVGQLAKEYDNLVGQVTSRDLGIVKQIGTEESFRQVNMDIAVAGEDTTIKESRKEQTGELLFPLGTPSGRQKILEQEQQATLQMAQARKSVYDDLVKRGKGIVGFSGGGAKETVYTRTRSIAFVILYAAFFLRMLYIMLAKLTGNVGWGGISPVALVLKMLMLTIAILAVPNIATFGMNVSDSARNYILDHSEKNPDFSPAQNTVLLSNRLADISRAAATALGGREDIQTRSWITGLVLQGIAWICSILVSAVLGTMLLLGDVMLGIVCVTAPLILAMSIVPSCENWLAQLANSYVGFLLYGPMAVLYMMIMAAAAVAYPSATILIFITLSMIYVKITSRLPDMCEGMSALAVSAVVTSMSAMPAHTAKKTLKVAGEHSTRGIRRALGAGAGGGKK